MRIMYDGMNLQLRRGTGVATYGRNLIGAMRAIGHEVSVLYGLNPDRRSDHVIGETLRPLDDGISRSLVQYALDMQRANIGYRAAKVRRPPGRHDLDHWFPPADAYLNVPRFYLTAGERFRKRGRFTAVTPPMGTDVAHWTYPIAARARRAVNVYTIHDMVQSRHPELTLDDPKRHAALMRGIAARADHILTVSEHSRRDIIDALDLPEDRVSNVYQPVVIPADALSGAAAAVDDAIGRHLGPGVGREGYFLFIGAIEPKKNLDRLIEAYAAAAPPQPLAIIGGVGWLAEQTLERIDATPNVHRLGHLPRQDMLALLAGARALCFPSLYEGFGLPVVEGFLCGAPVITAKGHSTEEVAGDAALLVDPYDVGEIKAAIARLAADDSEALRRELTARGRARAARFEPERIARDVDAVYRRILAERDRRSGRVQAKAPSRPRPAGASAAVSRPWTPAAAIPVTWMRQPAEDRIINVGDALSPVIVAAISGRPVRHANSDEPVERLAAVGTIGHGMRNGHVHFWGSGLDANVNPLAPGEAYAPPPDTVLEVHAMRGPFSAGVLRRHGVQAPEVYGDPAYLLPRIWPMPDAPKRYELGVVLHLSELEAKTEAAQPKAEHVRYLVPEALKGSVRLISMYAPDSVEAIREKIALICACKAVVSTSLHGLAIADAYGVPAAWFGFHSRGLDPFDPFDESVRLDHRFRDLFAGMGAPAWTYGAPRDEEMDWDAAIRAVQEEVAPSGFDAKPLFDAFPLPRAVDDAQPVWPLDTETLSGVRL